ncbi:MAG: hypothetical protein QW265_03215 [Candidatus Bathyarchaeia archaeon]
MSRVKNRIKWTAIILLLILNLVITTFNSFQIAQMDKVIPKIVMISRTQVLSSGTSKEYVEVDLSKIVPEGTKWVLLNAEVKGGSANQWVAAFLRRKGESESWVILTHYVRIEEHYLSLQVWVPCDEYGKIEYKVKGENPSLSLFLIGYIYY